MTEYRHLKIVRSEFIVTVQIDRAQAKNALNAELMAELTHVARSLRQDAQLRAVILCGSSNFFSAGADLSMVQSALSDSQDQDLMDLRQTLRAGPDMCDAWAAIEAPKIAAIEGFCVGGAVSLAVSCDFRIASDAAFMRLPEVPYGMNMSWHTLPRLTALIGPAKAKQMTLFGESVNAQTLSQWGLIDEMTSSGEALQKAMEWAEKLAVLPPLATRMTIEAINAVATDGHASQTFADRDQFLLTLLSGSLRPDR